MGCKPFFRRLTTAAGCLALLLCAMTVSVSAKVSDDLDGYARALASERGASVGGMLSSGSGSGQFQLNSTSATAGRGLYVIEVQTQVGYERVKGPGSNCHMDAAVFYLGTDNKVYWTNSFNFNDYAESFLNREAALRDNQNDALSIQLPASCRQVLAVYFHKEGGPVQGKYEWSASYLRVAKVSGSIGSVGEDVDGYRYRDYGGSYVGVVNDLNQLNFKGWGNYLWRLSAPAGTNNACDKSVYVVELVTGSDGYEGKNGSVTVNYTDSLGISYTKSTTFDAGYEYLFPGSEVKQLGVKDTKFDYDLKSTSWLNTSVQNMNSIGQGYVGNLYPYENTDTCLLPYTATALSMVLPQNIAKINSITVSLDEDDSLILQSVRFLELTTLGSSNYWNGSFSRERIRPWTGRLLAQSRPDSSTTVLGRNNAQFTAGAPGSKGLTIYPRGTGPLVDNTGDGVGIAIQFADVLGAGVESLLARKEISYGKTDFNASASLKSQAGQDALSAYFNLSPFFQECMTLDITYKDTLGATRKVSVPFVTTYLAYLLKANGGNLSGGDYTTWISGVLQQNENAALPLRLAEYESLTSLKLTYGSMPSGFASSNLGTIDAKNDPISVESIRFYEGVTDTNFVSKYNVSALAPVLNTALKPAYFYSSSSAQGQSLSAGGSLSLSAANGTLQAGAPEERGFQNKYLIRIKTSAVEVAGTRGQVSFSLSYTDANGLEANSSTYSLSTLAANFYGTSCRGADAQAQYMQHMLPGETCEAVVELKDVKSINAITLTLSGSDDWQLESVEVSSLTGLEQRTGMRTFSGTSWSRKAQGTQVAYARQSVLLSQNKNSKTVYFTTFDEAGEAVPPEQPTKTDSYLTSLPSSMTYEDTLKNLGLAIPKYTYQVDVQVANVEDAGSGNYFYFQLVFENGTSGVVLANQQLASDSFRQGITESFQIQTTQNYGNIQAVRIICDNTASSSNVFDKLNIESLTITLNSNSGVSRSWVVDRVGWIDINYVDEGSDYGVAGLDNLSEPASTNVELLKEFAVSRTATAVDLLFCVTTASGSRNFNFASGLNVAGVNIGDLMSKSAMGKFQAILYYRDSDGMEQSKAFQLTDQFKSYNDTDTTAWMFRPGHTDRFVLSLTDVRSVTALELTRIGGEGAWNIETVSIQQIGGLGEVYLSPTLSEYMRDPVSASDLAVSTNTASIPGNSNATITFTENSIDAVASEESQSWSAAITRVPITSGETLNIYLFPGSIIGRSYTFTSASPPIRATAKYTTVYGGNPVQNSFTLDSLGEIGGQTVLYGKGLSVSAMSSLRSLTLSSTSTAVSNQPVISHAVVERVKGNVILGTYYFDFANIDLGVSNPEAGASTTKTGTADMNQVVRLQLSANQLVQLTAESSDVAAALRYTSALDPADSKTVYQSPYFYLTDFGYATLTGGQLLELPFHVDGVGELVGLSVVSSGPNVYFDRAAVYHYAGGPETNSPATRLSICSLQEPFVSSSMESVLTGSGGLPTPVTFTFTTADDSELPLAGAGTSGSVGMTVAYVDGDGRARTETVEDLLALLPGSSIPSGSETSVTLLLDNVSYVSSLTLDPAGDPWFLTRAAVSAERADGTVSSGSTSVRSWVDSGLRLDVRPEEYRSEGEALPTNRLLSFTVTGRGKLAGLPASASNGSTLLVSAYPGDTVTLTPTAIPDGTATTKFAWSMGQWEPYLHTQDIQLKSADGAAAFSVPSGAQAGDSYTFSVIPHADMSMAVPITIVVADPPAEPEPDISWGGVDSGESAGDGGADSSGPS